MRPRSREMEICQNWDTSRVTILQIFIRHYDLVHGDRSMDMSNWDTSRVTTTFYGATSFTGDGVSNWDTSSVSRVTSDWDTSCVCQTFYGATSFTGDGVSNWDTSRVTICLEHSTVRPRSREMDCQIGIRRV